MEYDLSKKVTTKYKVNKVKNMIWQMSSMMIL